MGRLDPCYDAYQSPFFDTTVAGGGQSFSVYNPVHAPAHRGDRAGECQALLDSAVIWGCRLMSAGWNWPGRTRSSSRVI